MKKLFKKVAGFAALALAALVPSMSANAATIYLDASAARWTSANLHYWGNGTGDIKGEQVTGKSNFFKFTNVPDNQNGSFLFQTKQGEWNNNNNVSKNASDVSVTFTDGHVYKLTAREGQEGRWKFQDNIFYLYCKLEDYSDWDFNNPKATFAFNPDNGYYEAKVTTKAGNNGNYFFISTLNKGNDRSWDSHNNNRYTTGDGNKNPIGTWQTAKIADSGSYLVNGAYTDLLFQFDLDNGKVRAITEVTPPTPPTPGEISWYLDDTKFTKVSDGKFTLTKNMGTSDFHIYKEEGSSKQRYNYNSDKSYGWDINDGYDGQLFENDKAMKMINGGIYLYTIYFDGSNWKMKTVKAGNAPEHVYVIGSIKNYNWDTSSTPEMTKNDSKFTLSNVELVNDGDNDKAKFTLITKLGGDWKVVNGSNRFGPSSESDTDASTTAANKVKEYKGGTDNVGNAKNWLIAAGTYDLVFDYDALTLTITKSGVTPPTPGEISWYLDDTKFTKVSDGKFTLTKNMGTSDFHIYKEEGSSKQGYNYNDNPQYGWDINDGDDRQLHENGKAMKMSKGGFYLYTIYRDGSNNWKMKVFSTIAVPDKLDLNYKYDNKWTSVGMTKDGSKFTCTLKGVKKSQDYFFHFNSESACYQSTSDQNDAHYTNGDGRKLDFMIHNGEGNYDFKYWYGDSECDLKIEIDFSTMKVTVLRSNYTEPVQPDNQYYFLGDVNNWMNDGTYTTNGKEYGYGYSKAENGVRANYKFEPYPISGDDRWYVLDMSKTKTGGKLWGQFTIVQDNGVFQPAKLEENQNDGRDVINWNGIWEQWSNAYDRTSEKENYLNETVKAYKVVPEPSDLAASAGVAKKIKRSNFHLDHNLYKGVKIYFNPTDQKIFMTYSDYQDFYIYLSTDADRKENGDRKVNVIKESMNNENYTLDFSSLRVVTSDGTQTSDTETLMEHKKITDESSEGDELPNGLKFTNYWKIKIPNGLEGPSGQKFMVSLYNAKDENAQKMTSIFLNNLYFIDGVRVFATPSADVEVAAVSYRIYGLPADGDPENLQIFAADGTQKAVKEDPNDEFGWVDLQWGNFGYHPTSTSWWVGTVPAEYTQKTGFYPSFKDEARTVYHEVPASHASDCIQWKITYGKRPSAANGMKKTRTGVQLNPATADLTVDRSDLNADWVLNGRHKELEIGVATGVEDIEMEDGEISEEGEAVAPVYYNLQGVRVAEPQHGLYIKVTGNKSEKILVK